MKTCVILIIVIHILYITCNALDSSLTCILNQKNYLNLGIIYTCEVAKCPMYTKSNSNVKFDYAKSGTIDQEKDYVKGFSAINKAIFYLPKGIGTKFTNLKALQIYGSKLKKITPENLKEFKYLQFLDLSFNEIEILDNDLFIHNPNIDTLYFNNNRIIYIHLMAFKSLKGLKYLNLSGNICYDKDNVDTKSIMESLNKINKCSENIDQLYVAVLSALEKKQDSRSNAISVIGPTNKGMDSSWNASQISNLFSKIEEIYKYIQIKCPESNTFQVETTTNSHHASSDSSNVQYIVNLIEEHFKFITVSCLVIIILINCVAFCFKCFRNNAKATEININHKPQLNESTEPHPDHKNIPLTMLNNELIDDIHGINHTQIRQMREINHNNSNGNDDEVSRIDIKIDNISQVSEELYSEVMTGTENMKDNKVLYGSNNDDIYSTVQK